MNKEQFEKELDEKLASLKEEMMQKFEEERENEFPKYGDRYYYLTTRGNIENAMWSEDEFDRGALAMGNLFKTKEEAEFERERRKVITKLKKYAEPKDRKWDGEINHYYITWDYDINMIYYCCFNTALKGADIYFESEEKAKKAIKAVGEDRVKRYYLGVEE